MPNKIIFVAWNTTPRSRVLANFLQATIITYQVPTNHLLRLFNYPFLMFLTFCKLLQQKPDNIFVQLPPIQVSIPTFLYSKIFRKRLIFDTHSGIFFPKGIHQRLYYYLYANMIKHINLNLVHNDSILTRKCLQNTTTIVLEDKLPYQPIVYNPNKPLKAVIICGYGKDEPINEVLKAAELIPDIDFYLTGKSDKLKNIPMSQNVKLTGYLNNTDYEIFLRTADLIIALTTRPDTVLCGAYEAVGLQKPLITSDTETLRKYFNKGTIYTANNANAIAQAITEARKNLAKLYNEMALLRKEKETTWQKQFAIINDILKK